MEGPALRAGAAAGHHRPEDAPQLHNPSPAVSLPSLCPFLGGSVSVLSLLPPVPVLLECWDEQGGGAG